MLFVSKNESLLKTDEKFQFYTLNHLKKEPDPGFQQEIILK